MTKIAFRRTLALTALAVTALTAHAGKPANPGNGDGKGNVPLGACSVNDLSTPANACLGYVGGNDSPAELLSLVGPTWGTLALSGLTQYKDNNVAAGSTGALYDALQSSGDASTGTLSFLQNINGSFIITLKGGNEIAAYRMDGGISAGTVLGFDIPGVQGAGFSHASVYAFADSISNPVPEPESYALMLGGLAALAFVVRRRSA